MQWTKYNPEENIASPKCTRINCSELHKFNPLMNLAG